jgi:hypothetical protein
MSTTAGTGAMYCAHCGRPAATLVWIGGLGYHDECTRGPGYKAPTFQPLPCWPATLTEADVRRIVREEIAKAVPDAHMLRRLGGSTT